VDIIQSLDDLLGGRLLLWKVILTSLVFAGAGLQVLLAARFYQVSTVPPIAAGTAATIHRVNGGVTLALAVGPAGPTSPTRVLLHSIFGTLVFVLLALKFAVLKRLWRAGDRYLPWIGSGLFLTFAAIWATSVADYIIAR
jgi:hypothetical protein